MVAVLDLTILGVEKNVGFVHLLQWVRELEVSVRGGTRLTHSVSGAAAAVSISRRVDAPLVLTQLLVLGNITGVKRQSVERLLELVG